MSTSGFRKDLLSRFIREVWTDDRNRIRGHWQIADRLGIYLQLRAQTS